MTFPSGKISLSGTVLRAPNSRGIVIFVHGSGPQDRNENVGAQRLDVFNTLAHSLAKAGFSSLRYDKRGCGASGGNFRLHRIADLVADIQAAIATARSAELGPIYFCGHSEGTLLALMAAEGQDIAGLMLLCPFVTDMQDILIWQAEGGDRAVREIRGFKGTIARLAARILGSPVTIQRRLISRVLATESPYVRLMGRKIWVNWLRDLLHIDVAAVHRANTRPTLLVVAEKDVQCPPQDGARIRDMCPQADLLVIPDLTHLLRINEGPPGFANYPKELKQPVAPNVAEALRDWLDRQGTG